MQVELRAVESLALSSRYIFCFGSLRFLASAIVLTSRGGLRSACSIIDPSS
jgi:hypothetical protein